MINDDDVSAPGGPVRGWSAVRRSTDWDEINGLTTRIYMPHSVTRLDGGPPRAEMAMARLGGTMFTRFGYGASVRVSKLDPEAGKVLVATTLEGRVQHGGPRGSATLLVPSESFVADCRRAGTWIEADAHHRQLNLTVPHRLIEAVSLRWFDRVPDERLWSSGVKFGGAGTAWHHLLLYADGFLGDVSARAAHPALATRLEEMIAIEFLRNWVRGAGVDIGGTERSAAPACVRRAEAFMEAHARDLPSLCEVAVAAGVSLRTLSSSFRRFRGITPGEFLRERRLCGVRDTLLAHPEMGVSRAASEWGYVNFGILARGYRRRFGELPSETCRRR